MKILFFDTETSGLKPGQICQLSYVIADTEKKSTIGKNFYFTVDYVEPGAEKIHGLSIEKLKELSNGKTFEDNNDEIYKDFKSVDLLIGHNVQFDVKFISSEFERCGKNIKGVNLFCSMLYYIDICNLPGNYGKHKWPKLEEVVTFLNISKERLEETTLKFFGEYLGYHDSRYDIAGTYLIIFDGIKKGYFPNNYFTSGQYL